MCSGPPVIHILQKTPTSIPPKLTMKSISELRGKRVSTSEMAHIITAFNEKYDINQIDFDEMSYNTPSEAAHWAKVKDKPIDTTTNKKLMEQWKSTHKMLNEPRKLSLMMNLPLKKKIKVPFLMYIN